MTKLRKFITAAAAALTLSTVALAATPSSAYFFYVHHWGYHWGYHAYAYRPALVVAPFVGGTVCPPGTHSGYLGRHCWANR